MAAVLALLNARWWKAVPQGDRTGLAGGARIRADEIALSLERMRAIGPVDGHGAAVEVEAGALLQSVQEAARAAGQYYQVDLGARHSSMPRMTRRSPD